MKLAVVFTASKVIQNILDEKLPISLSYKILSLANQMNEDLKIIEKMRDSLLGSEDSDIELQFINFLNEEDSVIQYIKISFKELESSNILISPQQLKLLLPFLEDV